MIDKRQFSNGIVRFDRGQDEFAFAIGDPSNSPDSNEAESGSVESYSYVADYLRSLRLQFSSDIGGELSSGGFRNACEPSEPVVTL
jgi:hypothetical protein